MVAKSTASRARVKAAKPAKPYPTFPCYSHSSGRWAAKVRGKTHFFGRWGVKEGASIVPVSDVLASAEAAKAEYDRQIFYLKKGQPVPAAPADDGPDIFDLREAFLGVKEADVKSGKRSPRTYKRYQRAADTLRKFFGDDKLLASITVADFTRLYAYLNRGGKLNVVSLGNDIRHIKIVLKYAYDSEMIERPFRYGPVFKMPTAKEVRLADQAHRREHGRRFMEASQLRYLLAYLDGTGTVPRKRTPSSTALRAMILLGVNCGFGQTDVANLETTHLDLDRGWVDYPRNKTAVERRIPLWPETVAELREALAVRPKPKSAAERNCVFLTLHGLRWVRNTKRGNTIDGIGRAFSDVLDLLKLKRLRLSYYCLRHITETVGGKCRDQVAVDWVMGHAPSFGDMSAAYREGIDDDRLLAVTNTIREWLFGGGTL
ncbi:hypothetical protein VT03_01730 [Planctomyces sp. SH-PL14]|nr:hypothetical protein VT03_01730 [Planctomyces sp. SH-PL14]